MFLLDNIAIFSLCFTFDPSDREVLGEKLLEVLKDLHTISNAIKIGIYKSIFWFLILFLQEQNHIRKQCDTN